jgi:hypothetical protein
VLVRVTVHSVEYWQGPSTAIGKAVAFVIARVTKNDDAMGQTHLLRFKRSGEVTSRKVTTERPARPARSGTAKKTATKKGVAKKRAASKPAVRKSTVKKAPAKKRARR